MGLPIRRLIVATNENDVLDEFFRTGVYRPRASAETHATSSPSMDIAKASNFERFIADITGRDPTPVRDLWQQLARDGRFDLAATPCWQAVRRRGNRVRQQQHADRIATIRDIERRYGVIVDPHTADGLHVGASSCAIARVPLVAIETALPAKFAATIDEALARPAPRPAAYDGLEARAAACHRVAGGRRNACAPTCAQHRDRRARAAAHAPARATGLRYARRARCAAEPRRGRCGSRCSCACRGSRSASTRCSCCCCSSCRA